MWLFVPPLIRLMAIAIRTRLYFWIQPVNDWLADTSPVGLWTRNFQMRVAAASPQLTQSFLEMVEYQLAGAFVMLLIG